MKRIFIALLVLAGLVATAQAGVAGKSKSLLLAMLAPIAFDTHHSSYNGPCDVITGGCAEAYSVTRAMTSSYSGPLFQLYNGTTTLDIGQTTSHAADMTTWSSFCSGVASNCKITKIYAQIHGSANDLSPSNVSAPFGPNCTAGTTTCAAPFAVDGGTGLPIANISAPNEYVIGATDSIATGITGGTSAISVWVSGTVQKTATCCGVFGIAHKYSSPDTAGTDFLLWHDYTNNYNPTTANCATDACLGYDLEGTSAPISSYGANTGDNANWLVTWAGSGTNVFTGYYNGLQLFNATGGTGVNVPTYIHLGGGGDLSQPAPINFRSGFIANSVVSQADTTAVQTNESNFYSGITFKVTPATPIALVAHATAGTADTNTATTAGINTTGATLLVAAVSWYSVGTVTTLTDSKGNTWHPLTSGVGGNNTVQLFYCYPTSVGTGHIFTASGTGGYPSIAVEAFSGAAASSFDQQSAHGAATGGTPIQPGAISPYWNGEVFVTAVSFGTSSTPSIDSSFTISDTNNYVSGGPEGISMAYKIQTSGITQNPSWSTSSVNNAAAMATYHP